MITPTTDNSSQQLTEILTQVRQSRREISEVARMVNRFRYARVTRILLGILGGVVLGAAGCYVWLNRHTFPAGISIVTDSYMSEQGQPIVSVTVTGRGNYGAKQTSSEDKSRKTINAYFEGK